MAFGQKRPINWRNFWICFLISLGTIAFGYPAAIIGTTLGKVSFLEYMRLGTEKGVSPSFQGIVGAITGVFQAGAVVGVLLGCSVTDRWGRKAGIIYCATLSIIGGAGLVASQNVGMFIAFRFFAGAGSWGFLSVIPVYTSEMAPPDYRGFFVGMNGVMIGAGYALASWLGCAFYFASNPTVQWRAPLGLALLWPVLMLVVICFIPESPRFLLMQNKPEEAWQVVLRLHADPRDPDQEFARGEFYQIQKQVELDRTLSSSWLQMFKKRSYRKRSIMAMLLTFFGQSTAVLVINNYGPTFYKALGFNTRDQLLLQGGRDTVAVVGNFLGSLVLDRFGRRALLLVGFAGCIVCLSIESAMVALYSKEATNKAGLDVGIAALYTFLLFYASGIDVSTFVFLGEIFPNHIRAKGLALAVASLALTDLVYLQVTPTAFAAIGWKYSCAVGFAWLYFCVPETKGIPLEEIAAIFGDKDEVVVYLQDLQVDRNTHKLVVEIHGDDKHLTREVTEAHKFDAEEIDVSHKGLDF